MSTVSLLRKLEEPERMFNGTAQAAYLPAKGRVVGLRKIARALAVVIRAEHLCLRMRGAAKRGADMVTTAFRGEFERNQALRAEALGLLRPHGGAS